MHDKCTRVKELVNAELSVILTHIDNHKWYRHITDDTEALASFNEEFGPIIRDMYCRFACPDRDDCKLMLERKETNRKTFE